MRWWGYLLSITFFAGVMPTAFCQSQSELDGRLSRPRALDAKSACRLISQDEVSTRVIYSIPGIYFSDGHHGSEIEIQDCDQVIVDPTMVGEAAAKIAQYHFAFDKKCDAVLMNDRFSGIFTGKFVKRKVRLFDLPTTTNIFVVSQIESKELDVTSIACAPRVIE